MVDTKNTTSGTPEPIKASETPTDPNVHFHQWLTDNQYKVSVDALTEDTPFLEGRGFVLTDKPLLIVTVKRKENK